MIFENEAQFEQEVINALVEYGWEKEVLYYPTEHDLIKNWANILFANNRQKDRLNDCPLTEGEMQQVLEQIRLLQTPMRLNSFINGRSVSIKRDNPDDKDHLGKEVSLKIYDRQEIAYGESRYQIAKQPKFLTKSNILNSRRGDLMLLINGMPVIHIELKKSGIPVSQAYNQIEKYSHEGVFRGLFSLVQIFVAMQPEETVYFANPGEGNPFNQAFYFHWADFNNEPINDWYEVIKYLLNIPMAHMLIGFYTVADTDDGILKVMRSYQYYAAHGIADRVSRKDWGDGNQLGGYVWHTTGSGKTMTSFKSAQLIAASHDADKVIFLVDRRELATQSLKEYRSFANESESVQATENTDVLVTKLKSADYDNTLIVTSIQKLSNITEDAEGLKASDLKNIQQKRIVIIIDECHRSTFGEMLAKIKRTFTNAFIFGFTGTPIQDVNIKKDSTTPTIFGDEIHRYTLADGIRDRNVLGFDPYMVKIYDDNELRKQVALHESKAASVEDVMKDEKKKSKFYYFMDSSKVKMSGEFVNGKYVKGIEDYLPNEQYQTDEYRRAVVRNIKDNWLVYSRNHKFHAIFATSSIPEAVIYYRLFKEEMPELSVTAMFDPTIDNEGKKALDKEDGIVEILEDYNEAFSQTFSLASYESFRKDVSRRLSHKKPYENIEKEEQLQLLIVVNQMLTGFDSKWVNSLYLDKMLEYEHLIQAFSRTNRIFNFVEKPFGIIKYYRRPHTMEQNIEKAVKAYSGDIPQGFFVNKLPKNLKEMNRTYDEIKELFEKEKIENFEKLPEDTRVCGKFAKLFKEFSSYLDAALIQGFYWNENDYLDEEGQKIDMHFTELDYRKLLARYKELSRGGGGKAGDVPYDIDIHITQMDSEKIDAEYMNSRFDKYLKSLELGNKEDIDNTLKDLHQSFSMLSQEEQKYANIFIHDIQAGNVKICPDKGFKEYLYEYMKKAEDEKITYVVDILGCSEVPLRHLMEHRVTEENIADYGIFDELKESVDIEKASLLFRNYYGENYDPALNRMYIDTFLRAVILEDGLTTYEEAMTLSYTGQKESGEHKASLKPVDVILTDRDLKGKRIVNSVSSAAISDWYQKSPAFSSIIASDAFAYVENKLCLYDSKYIERDERGQLRLSQFAKDHEDECFLQFVIDGKTGQLHYLTLPKALASKTFNYYDELPEDILSKYGLVSEISKEMLDAIAGLDFGHSLRKLMSNNICNYSVRLLRDTTGLDNRTISEMQRSKRLTKCNVISACLGIHIPSRVSKKLLELAEISLNINQPGDQGAENDIYVQLIHLKWATDYSDVWDELNDQGLAKLIKKPKL